MTSDVLLPERPIGGEYDGGGFIAAAFRIFWLLAVLLLGGAVLCGYRARRSTDIAPGSARSAVHVISGGSTTRVGIDLPDGENVAHIAVIGPAGEDLFELTYHRSGYTDIRFDDRRGNQSTVLSGPDGGVVFQIRRKNGCPTIGTRSRGKSLEILWQECPTGTTPGYVRVDGYRTAQDALLVPVKGDRQP